MEPIVKTTEDLKSVLARISFVNTVLDFKWRFEYDEVAINCKNGWLVWVTFERPDTITGEVGRGRGRDEVIYAGSTVSSIVKTCWLLVELMVRHELMEGFRFDDGRIFNPHNSVFELLEVQKRHSEKTI